MVYIHERSNWPNFHWDKKYILDQLAPIKFLQGQIIGRMESLGFSEQELANLTTLTEDVVKSSEIEGEKLDGEEVRSSLARHLGMDIGGLKPSDRHVDGMVEMILDATRKPDQILTTDRLFHWHALLFPTGISGMMLINAGMWRTDDAGPMQVISGAYGKTKVHFEAPPAEKVDSEMKKFLHWFEDKQSYDLLIKAAIAHFWFITIHPFDDGNGRIARAITDLLLAQSDKTANRFYSMSTQIRKERKRYYELLEKCQKGDLDITTWIQWFLGCLERALTNAEKIVAIVLEKSEFWKKHANRELNARQIKMLNKLFDGFKGKLTSSKWAKMNNCSQDTASRDIKDLINKKILVKSDESGRSTNYLLKEYHINQID